MLARVITYTGAKAIDDGLVFMQEKALPVVRQQSGYAGLTISADRQGAVFGILALWETQADLEASEKTLAPLREEGRQVMGGDLTVEHFEEAVREIKAPPAPGKTLLIQRGTMDPGRLADNAGFFKSEIAPKIAANAGFCALRNLVNREAGDSIVGTVWDSPDAMRTALANSQELMQQAVDRGVTFGEMSEREILFLDMP